MALKDKAARAAYNKLYRERRAASLSEDEKLRLREHHNERQRRYCRQGYDKNKLGYDRQRLQEPRTIAEARAALRWDRMWFASQTARRAEVVADAIDQQYRDLSEVWWQQRLDREARRQAWELADREKAARRLRAEQAQLRRELKAAESS